MGLVFVSQEDTLKMTGVPVRLYKGEDGAPDGLVVNFLSVTNPAGRPIESGFETKVPLTQEWLAKASEQPFSSNDRFAFDLEVVRPEGENERALHQLLVGDDSNVYVIKQLRVEPNPMAAFK